MSAGLAVVLGALGGVGLWFCAAHTRPRAIAKPPAWACRSGAWLPAILVALQAACAALSYGPAAATALVSAAWMLAGSLFVPWVNHAPQRALSSALACAAAGATMSVAIIVIELLRIPN